MNLIIDADKVWKDNEMIHCPLMFPTMSTFTKPPPASGSHGHMAHMRAWN